MNKNILITLMAILLINNNAESCRRVNDLQPENDEHDRIHYKTNQRFKSAIRQQCYNGSHKHEEDPGGIDEGYGNI